MAPEQPQRRADDRMVPSWALDMRDEMARMETRLSSRLSRLEAGVALIGFIIMAGIGIFAALHGRLG